MTHQAPQTQTETGTPSPGNLILEEHARRAGLYSVLAALLRDTPSPPVLDFIGQLDGAQDNHKSELAIALNMLVLAARHNDMPALTQEFHTLFIGLGRGEVVPYGSWYQTGFLMEKPLSQLRGDLARLGFERDSDVHEPEDHIAALCEVMAMLIQSESPLETQRSFFEQHIGCWATDFFSDLGRSDSAILYRSVARLGLAFVELESAYLSLPD